MKNRSAVIVLGFSASLLFAACTETSASVTVQPSAENQHANGPPAISPLVSPLHSSPATPDRPDSGGGVRGEAPQEMLERILTDAAARSGLDVGALAIIQDQAVVWPDGSLGCPQPGMMYTQALVEGYHILIQTGEGVLDYRATQRGSFVLCENALRLSPAQTPTQ